MSAHAMVSDRDQALASGCAGFIAKPIDTRVFAGQLRGFLQQPATADSAS